MKKTSRRHLFKLGAYSVGAFAAFQTGILKIGKVYAQAALDAKLVANKFKDYIKDSVSESSSLTGKAKKTYEKHAAKVQKKYEKFLKKEASVGGVSKAQEAKPICANCIWYKRQSTDKPGWGSKCSQLIKKEYKDQMVRKGAWCSKWSLQANKKKIEKNMA